MSGNEYVDKTFNNFDELCWWARKMFAYTDQGDVDHLFPFLEEKIGVIPVWEDSQYILEEVRH